MGSDMKHQAGSFSLGRVPSTCNGDTEYWLHTHTTLLYGVHRTLYYLPTYARHTEYCEYKYSPRTHVASLIRSLLDRGSLQPSNEEAECCGRGG